jgi:hypothetical protein
MDPRLVVPDTPRPGVPPGLADLPLFTLAWRALKAEAGPSLSRKGQTEEARSQEKKRRQALLALANEIFRLRSSGLNSAASATVERLAGALMELGVEIIAPVGEVYSEGLMEVLDNLAQQPTPGLYEARVQEVIVPTILLEGEVAQIGKAVIAVPELTKQDSRLEQTIDNDSETHSEQDRRWINEINRMGLDLIRKDQIEKTGGENG